MKTKPIKFKEDIMGKRISVQHEKKRKVVGIIKTVASLGKGDKDIEIYFLSDNNKLYSVHILNQIDSKTFYIGSTGYRYRVLELIKH